MDDKELAEELHEHSPFPRVAATQNAENSHTSNLLVYLALLECLLNSKHGGAGVEKECCEHCYA